MNHSAQAVLFFVEIDFVTGSRTGERSSSKPRGGLGSDELALQNDELFVFRVVGAEKKPLERRPVRLPSWPKWSVTTAPPEPDEVIFPD
jgi:hypothetical protein